MADRSASGWIATGGWGDVATHGRSGCPFDPPGIRVEVFGRPELATIVGRPGQTASLDRLMIERFAIGVPAAGEARRGPQFDLVWSAPGRWLAIVEPLSTLDDLAENLAGIAGVIDQSDSRALVRVGGPKSRAMLAKGFTIDLYPTAFPLGSTAVTSVAHIGAQIWRLDEDRFTVAVPRSFAGSFWSWLVDAAAEFGCEVGPVA